MHKLNYVMCKSYLKGIKGPYILVVIWKDDLTITAIVLQKHFSF